MIMPVDPCGSYSHRCLFCRQSRVTVPLAGKINGEGMVYTYVAIAGEQLALSFALVGIES